ncbi:LPS export ABC transporter ATP-binding protein [Candidatus Bandiella euplotis]|uniref:LPS export ABC transporter ATP-binding protein n=1 Tax=Candidatus Bandiella euplotis TaxID=1664265 RepID=A0ABZ0UJN1_9RICK|nr:LPS export ABC transporter ATP-binding protein [Candidatus Bandiella woodruffii]WPX96147.1 Putative LPS export ABC transporter ATP-binding protein [Candidatus Bandiella woodruffii]
MLVAENLCKIYSKRNVVKNVTFSIQKSEIVGLLGPNGSGKSTSFYMLAGLIKPDHGKVFLNGIEITHLSLAARAKLGIAYLPQESSIFRGMTVSENIMTVLEITEKEQFTKEQRLEELLAEFSIEHLRSANAVSLSGGERRRLEIARCVAMEPKYILLDEPLAGIDPIAIDNLVELIKQLKARGIGILITDHNVKEALSLIDRAYILYNGEVIACDSSDKIVQNNQVRHIYLGKNF